MSKRCVIIQGPTHDYERMRKAWSGFDIIYSTWEGEEEKGYTESDCVIYNKMPKEKGPGNINLQIKSSLSGLKKAKEQGYDFCLKWRSDYIPKNANKFFDLFDEEKLNFIAWSEHRAFLSYFRARHGYLIDYFFSGKTDWLIDIFKETKLLHENIPSAFPEYKITLATYKVKTDNKLKINYLLPKITSENECFFIREGADYNSSTLNWKKEEYWNNITTRSNVWASI
tara:strand:- start:4856 stop:5536 length:681 start_codon:yes stop_codon:yes gene_type:complete